MSTETTNLTTEPSLPSNHVETKPKSTRSDEETITGEPIMDLKEFEDAVEVLATKDLNFILVNPGIKHAGVVLTTMAKHAKEKFFVYDENLEGDITDGTKFYEHINNFLENGGSLCMVTRNQPQDNDSKKTLLEFREKYKDRVDLRYIDNAKIDANFDNSLLKNCFTVMDDKAYRLEYDFLNRKAFFNFNDKIKAEQLTKKLDKIKEVCAPL